MRDTGNKCSWGKECERSRAREDRREHGEGIERQSGEGGGGGEELRGQCQRAQNRTVRQREQEARSNGEEK